MANGQFVAYFRVSTARQGQSGLGLEAQQQAVKQYLNGGNWQILAEFTEVESGKRSSNRPKLAEAIELCKKHKATLIIAKLDRLARNVHFISGLMESGIEFIAVDNPNANRLMLHLLAAFAEHEREQISQRTKDALAAAKARGVKLGKHSIILSQQNHDRAMDFALSLQPVLDAIRSEGYTTTRSICEQLNLRGVPTYGGSGRKWHIGTTHKLLQRVALTNFAVAVPQTIFFL
jgi:DNA invertase Pin-like site-specific DNA recombinase